VEIFPEIGGVSRSPSAAPELPPPWDFVREQPPYSLTFPSQAASEKQPGDIAAQAESGDELDNLAARARGEVTHRLFQTTVRGEGLPGEEGVAAALVGLGVPRETAQTLAPEILAEVAAALQDPFLHNLLTPAAAVSEWALEDQPAVGVIRRGRLDLLAFDGRAWWLVDFKTSRPPAGENWEVFLAQEKEKYRPQLEAYRDMTARLKGISPPETIRLALYFTACRQAVELKNII
jgi:ATP-dependent exoDNAse (exonuclease V) beta subunit